MNVEFHRIEEIRVLLNDADGYQRLTVAEAKDLHAKLGRILYGSQDEGPGLVSGQYEGPGLVSG